MTNEPAILTITRSSNRRCHSSTGTDPSRIRWSPTRKRLPRPPGGWAQVGVRASGRSRPLSRLRLARRVVDAWSPYGVVALAFEEHGADREVDPEAAVHEEDHRRALLIAC